MKKLLLFSLLQIVWLPPLLSQGITRIDSLKLTLEVSDNITEKTVILLELSSELKNSNPQKALLYAKKALELARKIDDNSKIVNSYIALAQIFWNISDFKKAMIYAEKAKTNASNSGMDRELALSLRIMGMIYAELSNYDKSSECFFKGLKIFEKLNDKQGISKMLGDIGSVNYSQENFEKALKYYFKSLNISKEINYKEGIARGLNNIAAVFETMKKYDKAAEYFKNAVRINHTLGNKRSEGINLMNLGNINYKLGNNDSALIFFNKALNLFTQIESKFLLASCRINLAKFFLNTANYNKSLNYAFVALNDGKKYGFKQIIRDAAQIIQMIYVEQGNKEKAYDYLALQYKMNDSLMLMENKAKLAKLELQYNFDKEEEMNRLMQSRHNRLVFMLISGLLLFLFIIIFVLIKIKQRAKKALNEQQRLKNELEVKNKELTTDVMTMMKKNDMLTTVSNKLSNVKNNINDERIKNELDKISRDILKAVDKEVFKEFEFRFKQVHNDFFDKLLKQYPDLTPNELRLCAFLKLNMSSKQISEITRQRISTIETARYRLRKKLGINNSQTNLVVFLSQL